MSPLIQRVFGRTLFRAMRPKDLEQKIMRKNRKKVKKTQKTWQNGGLRHKKDLIATEQIYLQGYRVINGYDIKHFMTPIKLFR